MNKVMIRNRHGLDSEMESLFIIWCENHVMKNCPIEQNTMSNEVRLILEKRKEISDKMSEESFVASNGGFHRFKLRCNFHSISISGEAANADKKPAFSVPNHIKKLAEQEGCRPKTVFNVNETGLLGRGGECPKSIHCTGGENVLGF